MYYFHYYLVAFFAFMAITIRIVNGSWNTTIYFLNLENNPPYNTVKSNDISGENGVQLINPDNIGMIEKGFQIMTRKMGREKWNNFTETMYRHHKRFKTTKELVEFISPNQTRSRKDLYKQLNITKLNNQDIFVISTVNHLATFDDRFFYRVKLFVNRKHVLVVPTESILLTKQFLHSFGQCISTLNIAMAFAVNIAALIWLIEHKTNPDFEQNFGIGLGSSIWFCIVTMTTVGYGDKVPKHFVSKLLMSVWMLFGLMLTAFITTNVMESVSKGTSKHGKIISCHEKTPARGSVNRIFGATLHEAPSYRQAIDLVKSGTVDGAFVDVNVAAYYLANNDPAGYLKIESEYDIAIPIFAYVMISDSHSLIGDFVKHDYEHETYIGEITMQVLINKYVPNYTVYPYYLRSFRELFMTSDYSMCLLVSAILLLVAAVVCEALRWSRESNSSVVSVKNNVTNTFEGSEKCQKMITEMERQFQEMMVTMRRIENDMRRQSKRMTGESI